MQIALRPWRPDDAPALAALINDRAVQDNLRDGIPYPYTAADGAAFLAETLAADPDTTFAYAVTTDGRLAGSIAAYRQGNIHRRTAELGYYLGRDFWGRGVATAAVRLLCERLFDTTDLVRLFAEPFADNAASRRVLEKAGFTLEGVLRRNAVKNGRLRDMCLYARLRPGI